VQIQFFSKRLSQSASDINALMIFWRNTEIFGSARKIAGKIAEGEAIFAYLFFQFLRWQGCFVSDGNGKAAEMS
jgi:hypothetical protein